MEMWGIHYAQTSHLFYMPLFLACMVMCLCEAVLFRRLVSTLVHPKHKARLFLYFSPVVQLLKECLLAFALIVLALALLRPQWGTREQAVAQEGRDVVIVLDISRSMLAKDVKPNRLEYAKLKIRTLLSMLSFERVALVLFSGSAYIQCPLTSDYGAFITFLNHVDVETISSNGATSLDAALFKVMEIFASLPPRKNKLALLCTDGEDFSANMEGMKQHLKENNVTVFALGIGTTAGAPVPIIDIGGRQTGYEIDEKGNPILSALNEELLKKLCEQCGGIYSVPTQDDRDLGVLVQALERFEREKFDDRNFSNYEDYYFYFIALACVLLLIEWIL